MRDVLGWRRKFGVIGPSTNTVVQPDFEMMRPVGVTNHYSRIFTPDATAVSNDSFKAATAVIAGNVIDAVRSVMTCAPDYLVMGMSAVTFIDGEKGADAFTRQVEEASGVKISIGSHSSTAALRRYGGVRRISILSPVRSDFTILSKMASTMTSDSLRVISTTLETSSIKSAFVILCSSASIVCETAVSLDYRFFASYSESRSL